jgi:hypothetical protein
MIQTYSCHPNWIKVITKFETIVLSFKKCNLSIASKYKWHNIITDQTELSMILNESIFTTDLNLFFSSEKTTKLRNKIF